MHSRIYKKVWLLSLVFFLGSAFCATASAASNLAVMLQQVSIQLLTALKVQRASIKKNPRAVHAIVQRILVPHFALNRMSGSVIGPQWRKATEAQKKAFKGQFIRYVTRTYSSALSSYRNEKVLFYPVRGGVGSRSTVQVRSKIVRPDGPPIAVSYRLIRVGGTWKVSDFSVEGISMVSSYRSQFSGILSQKGLSGLIRQLQAHNRGLR